MPFKSRLLTSMAILASLSVPALSADLDTLIPAQAEDGYVPVEIGSGWYIRGDVSYDLASSMSGTYRTYGAAPSPVYSTNDYDNFDLGAGGDFDAGFGYQFNNWLRADTTLGYWARGVNGTDTTPAPCDPTNALAVGCRSEDTTKMSAWELMANAYVDLGTFIGVTPYLGAGAGLAKVKYSDLSNISFCTDAAGADITGCGYIASHPGADSWRFTWALMAGASVDVSKNTKLDFGYRYARLSGGDMFNWDNATALTGATGIQGKDSGFSQHQFKVGVRYEIW